MSDQSEKGTGTVETAQSAVFPQFGKLDPKSYIAAYVGSDGKRVRG
jgi:hypothetical protein